MNITLNDLRELLGETASSIPASNGVDPLDPTPGTQVIIRTVTMTLTGRVVGLSPTWIALNDAAWIADSGRWSTAIATGALAEVEPMGNGVRVARAAVVDITPWNHDLPTEPK